MKKLHVILIAATMSFALCACGTEATGSMSITETGEQQTVKQNTGTEQTDTEENSLKQDTEKTTSEISESQQTQTKKSSYLELDKVLDEINTEIKQGTAGSGSTSIKVAAHLLNWGVGTRACLKKAFRELRVPVCGRFYPNEGGVAGYGNRMRGKYTAKWGLQIAEMIFQTRSSMTTDEIKEETVNWLSDKGNSEQVEFSNKLASVYEAYNRLLGSDAKQLLESAGGDDAAYPWSDSPVETIEAIVEVVQLPDEVNEEGSSVDPSWEDVVELVNLRGDETTVYLLADGRYMDRTNAVYIFDGADTWTDESGVKWNKAVK